MRKMFLRFFVVMIISICVVYLVVHRIPVSRADDGLSVLAASPSEAIDQIMVQIGAGKIDDAISMMDGLNTQPTLRDAARDRLLRLRDEQGKYRGYDIAAVQRFTPQFQTFDIMAYYDLQPVLLHFHFYRAQMDGSSKWAILGFQETASLQELVDILKDKPMDYGVKKVEK